MNRVGPTATLALISAGTAAVLALWWHSTRAIVGPGGALTTLGEALGLLAGYGVGGRGTADGAPAAGRARRRRRPAGPLARHPRPGAVLGHQRARAVHHLGLRAGRARERGQRDGDAAHHLPRRADGHRRLLPAARGGAHLAAGAAPHGSATRPGTTCTSTPTWRSRWRSATSSPTAPPSSTNAAARLRLGAAVHRHRRADRLVPAHRPGPRLRPPPLGRGGRARRGEPHRLRLHPRTEPGRARRRPRPVLPLAVPDPGAVVAVAPVLAVGAAERRPDADHGPRRRRSEQHAPLAPARHPGARGGAVRRVLPRPARAATGRPCCWRAASASPRCGR